jgi:hypothetical protein
MEEKLEVVAEKVRNSEYEDLFPDTPVEEAKEDREMVKEAVFQARHKIYNPDIEQMAEEADESFLSLSEVVSNCHSRAERDRLKKLLEIGTDEDGNSMVTTADLKQVTSTQPSLY